MIEIKLAYAAVVIALFTLIVINFAVMAYVGLFKLTEMESHLKHCDLVNASCRETNNGLRSRKYRLTLISAMLSKRPSWLLLDDPLALEDVRRFPLRLRRWIEIPYRINACSVIGMIVVYGWGMYTGLVR